MGRRIKYLVILAVLVGGGLGLLAVTQTWFTVTLAKSVGHAAPLTVTGSDAAPALTALSLASLALALALAIAGRLARIFIAVLGLVLAACLVYEVSGVLAHSGREVYRIAGVAKDVTTATGITGDDSLGRIVTGATGSALPAVALAGGILIALGCLAALITGHRWPGGSRRYEAARFEDPDAPAQPAKQPDSRPGDVYVDQWDELTRGDDPTR